MSSFVRFRGLADYQFLPVDTAFTSRDYGWVQLWVPVVQQRQLRRQPILICPFTSRDYGWMLPRVGACGAFTTRGLGWVRLRVLESTWGRGWVQLGSLVPSCTASHDPSSPPPASTSSEHPSHPHRPQPTILLERAEPTSGWVAGWQRPCFALPFPPGPFPWTATE